MDSPFIYDKYVTGKNFIGRKEDSQIVGNLLSQGEHVVLYEPPKTGKMSLIQQTLFNMRISGGRFAVGEFSVLSIRSIKDFLLKYVSTAIRAVATTPTEYKEIVGELLAGTHLVFDEKAYADKDEVISASWDLDKDDMKAAIDLPHSLAIKRGVHLFMIINEFQNIMMTEDGETVLKALENTIKEHSSDKNPGCTYIFSGSMVNAMKYIFVHRGFFYRQVNHFRLSEVNEKVIAEHVMKGFLSGGKVIDRDLLLGVCRLFRNNLWYINHFSAVCNSLSKGYVVESTLLEALGCVLSVHTPKFVSMMNDLTTFQTSLLKAVLDGKVKFSTAEVIRDYSLNSSANVKRVKDALMKKEILTFGDNDEPVILDPLFEYWAKNYFYV